MDRKEGAEENLRELEAKNQEQIKENKERTEFKKELLKTRFYTLLWHMPIDKTFGIILTSSMTTEGSHEVMDFVIRFKTILETY